MMCFNNHPFALSFAFSFSIIPHPHLLIHFSILSYSSMRKSLRFSFTRPLTITMHLKQLLRWLSVCRNCGFLRFLFLSVCLLIFICIIPLCPVKSLTVYPPTRVFFLYLRLLRRSSLYLHTTPLFLSFLFLSIDPLIACCVAALCALLYTTNYNYNVNNKET